MKKKLLDRRGAAIELAIMMMVFSIFITTIVLTTALLQNEHKAKAELGIKQDILLEQLGEDFVDAVLKGEMNTDWKPLYDGFVIEHGDAAKHNWGDYVVTEATCTEAGKKTRYCLSCEKKETIIIEYERGHIVEGATCKNPTGVCSVCNEEATMQVEHDWVWEDARPSCTEDVLVNGKCNVCGDKQEGVVSALGHKWVEEVLQEATCESAGTKTRICERCSAGGAEEIPALEHMWDVWVVDTEATTETHGVMRYTCILCNNGKMEDIHYLVKDSTTVNQPCKNQSIENYVCTCITNDGKCKKTETKILPLEPHSFDESGICSVCGARRHNYVLTVMTAGKNAYKMYIQETESVLTAEEIPEETTEPEATEPEMTEICGSVVLKISLVWSNEDNAYKITEWSKK